MNAVIALRKARRQALQTGRLEALARRRVLQIIQSLRDAVVMQSVARAIRERGAWFAVDEVPLTPIFAARLKTELPRLFRESYQTAGERAAERLQARLVGKDVSFRTRVRNWGFDVLNARGLDYLRRHGAQRVVQITDETRKALRTLLSRMYEDGVPALEQARRVKTMVGLTEQHAVAVENLRTRLEDMGTAPARVESLVARKIRELTELRALNIARTETMSALAAGRTESWRQAADEGLVNRSDVTRVWQTAEDEQTCPICEPMDGQESDGLDGMFQTGDGDMISDPPAHVNCRCDVDVRV